MATQIDGAVQREVGWLFDGGTMVPLGDGTLIERFATRRDEAAFAALVERHGPMVLRVCRAALGDEHEAHDAFQAAFLVLVRKARTLWVRDSVGPWLHGVAWRIALRARKSRGRRRRMEQRAAEMAPKSVTASGESRDVETLLHEEIHKLPDRFRAVVILCDLEGLGTDEAAKRLGTPVGTARSRLSRGRERLRSRLIRRGIGPAIATAVTTTSANASVRLPAALVETTLRAAVEFARVGTVSAPLALLMKGGHQVMTIKAWTIAGVVAVAGVVAGASAIVAQTPTKGSAITKPEAKSPSIEGTAKPTDISTDLARLQGRWTVIAALLPEARKAEGPLFSTITFRGEEVDVESPQPKSVRQSSRFKIDPDGEPRAMRVVPNDLSLGKPRWWAYAFEKDTLRIAWIDGDLPEGRPKSFLMNPENTLISLQLVRETVPPTSAAEPIQAKPASNPVTDKNRLQGKWKAVRVLQNGRDLIDPSVQNITMTVLGDRLEIAKAKEKDEWKIQQIDEQTTPRAIQVSKGNATKDRSWWIYAFTGDRLRMNVTAIGFGDRRPKGFDDYSNDTPFVVVDFVRDETPRAVSPSDRTKTTANSASLDRERLLGHWIVRKAKVNGGEFEASALDLASLTFDRNQFLFEIPGRSRKLMAYRIDPEARPKAFRVVNIDGNGGDDPGVWLYDFEDGRLKLAFDDSPQKPRRPKSFDDFDPARPLFVLELDRDDPPPVFKTTGTAASKRPLTAVETDHQRLLGKWKVLKALENGVEVNDTGLVLAPLTIGPEEIELDSHLEGKQRFSYRIDPEADPRVLIVVNQKQDKSNRWLYKFEGDKLKIAFDAAEEPKMPRSFDKPEQGQMLLVLDLVRDEPSPLAPKAEAKPVAATENDLARLKGTWKLLAREENGQELTTNGEESIVIAGNAMVTLWSAENRMTAEVSSFTIDPSKEPKTIDLYPAEGAPNQKPGLGIYKVEGTTLLICLSPDGKVRPTEFDTKPGTEYRLIVLRRKKPMAPVGPQ